MHNNSISLWLVRLSAMHTIASYPLTVSMKVKGDLTEASEIICVFVYPCRHLRKLLTRT